MAAGCGKDKGDDPGVSENRIEYEFSNDIFPNPERGFIKTYPVYSGGTPLAPAQLQLLRGQNVSLILRVYYFDAFKSAALDAAQLDLISQDFANVRAAGLKIILRFAYTDQMTGTDAPLNIINQHLDQLKPLFENNADVIAFVQAGFIGAYGEWHSSSNGLTTVEARRAVVEKLLSVLPQQIMIQVRTPTYKQQIFNSTAPVTSSIAYTAEQRARVGHHNDCFLSGGNEYGTYNNIELEKQFINNEAMFVPVGGETCPPTGGYSPTCVEGQREMKFLRWTYLNLDWYPATINAWRNSGCFDDFQRFLGYRLALISASVPKTVTANAGFTLKLSMTNRGYAPLYFAKKTSLVFKSASGQYYEKQLVMDARSIKPSVTTEITENITTTSIPAGEYELFIKIADMDTDLALRPEYAVRLGNRDAWVTDNGGMNKLKTTITIGN